MARSSDTPGYECRTGRIGGKKVHSTGNMRVIEKNLPDLNRPAASSRS